MKCHAAFEASQCVTASLGHNQNDVPWSVFFATSLLMMAIIMTYFTVLSTSDVLLNSKLSKSCQHHMTYLTVS